MLGILIGQFGVEVEYRLSRRISTYVSGSLMVADLLLAPPINLLSLSAGARFYVGSMPVEGFWFGVDAGVAVAWKDSNVGDGQLFSAGIGYTWVFGKSFVLSIGGGGQMVVTDNGVGFLPTLRFSLGFAR